MILLYLCANATVHWSVKTCCCIVLLTTLSPLDALRLSTRSLPMPLMAVGLSQPFRSIAQMHDYHCKCIFPYISFGFLYCFYHCLYLSDVTNKVVQSINRVFTKKAEQSGCHFADSIFKDILTDENILFAMHISHISYILYRAECISYLAIRLVS